MQRLYSTFALGSPGVGLALLRGAVAVQLVADTQSHLASQLPAGVASVVTWAVALTVTIGVATIPSAILCAVLQLGTLIQAPTYELACGSVFLLTATALALLGPGGYSIDARILGRRVIVLSSKNRNSDPRG